MSGAMNLLPHFVHLNVVKPLNISLRFSLFMRKVNAQLCQTKAERQQKMRLQCRGVVALVAAIGMVCAGGAGHHED